jgi:CubicO group peptidase (beta-lactamase class C family)
VQDSREPPDNHGVSAWLGPRGGPRSKPRLSSSLSTALDAVLEQHFGAVQGALAPAAVAIVARQGAIAYKRAIGEAQLDTAFDLASVTKAVFTAPMVMMLVDDGSLDLDAPIATVLQEWRHGPFHRVTLSDLLRHRAGLWEWRPVYFHASDPDAAIRFVLGLGPRYPPGTTYAYSDLGLMVVGEVLRRATGKELGELMRERLAAPLGLRATFQPPAAGRSQIAPASIGDWYERRMVETGEPYPVPERGAAFTGWRERLLVAEANDGNAFHAFAGVAGHAGLFATAGDLVEIGAALLRGDFASRAVLDRFASETVDPGQGLVFRTTVLAGERALWHPGFTGTRWLLCPRHDLVVVLLTNRLHVEGEPRPVDAAWEAVLAAVAVALLGN